MGLSKKKKPHNDLIDVSMSNEVIIIIIFVAFTHSRIYTAPVSACLLPWSSEQIKHYVGLLETCLFTKAEFCEFPHRCKRRVLCGIFELG